MKKTFWLLDVNYEVENHQPEVWLWGIDDEGKRILIVDRNFEPYFYLVVEEKADPKAVIEEVKSHSTDFLSLAELEPVNRRLFGKPVNAIKVVCRDPEILPQCSKALKKVKGVKKCLEDDLRYSMRYLIDNDMAPCGWHEAEVEEIENEFGVQVEKTYLAKSSLKSIEKAEPYVLASLDEIDVEYYVSKQVVPVASRVLSVFGIAEDQLLPSDKPKTLFDFVKN